MMKSKKGLSGVLAVLMLVSMLSCFALPVTAVEANGNYYYVASAKEWNDLAAEINAAGDSLEGKEIHIQNDISFENVSLTAIDNFKGTLDGHGYKFTNITTSTALIDRLYGTIRDLTLDATCTFSGLWTANFGPFAQRFVGTIERCVSYATVTGSGNLSDFVGQSNSRGTIKGCIAAGTTGKFEGTTAATVQYCYPHATITDVYEAIWTINKQIETDNAQTEIRFLNVDANGIPCLGDENNRVVRVMYEGLDDNPGPEYYAPRSKDDKGYTVQTRKKLTVTGKGWEVSGAECRGAYLYIGNSDITVKYVDDDEYNLQQARAQLQAMVDAYQQMNPAYFTDWEAKQNWAANAEADLGSNTLSVLQGHIDAEKNIDDNVVSMTKPQDYPSVKDYNIYKYIDTITDYKVEDAAAWMKAVELSNHVETPNATNFSGITLHLTANINMASAPMKPLCYGGIFDGNLDGHDKVFQNIKIEIDSSYGTVGLIGVLGETGSRYVQNVGIESGSIKVTGWPRYKEVIRKINYAENCVGGIVGEYKYAGSLIRKCWNNAEVSAKNVRYMGGILGDGRENAIVDSCFNLGYTERYGILGYGYRTAITCNSMSGLTHSGAALYRSHREENIQKYDPTVKLINISGVRSTLTFDNLEPRGTEDRNIADAFTTAVNDENTESSNAAAAWRVNANYVQQSYGNGERIYYTLNENGDVRFGNESNQIYRIKMVCDQHGETCADHSVRYAYGIAGQSIPLSFDIGANYYACDIKDVEGVTIDKENVLTFSKDVIIKVDETLQGKEKTEAAMTIPVYVDYNADRGNVHKDDKFNVLDVLDAVRIAVKSSQTTADRTVGDVNSDHIVDIKDAYLIIRYVLKKDTSIFTPGTPTETKDQYLKVLSYNIKGCYYDPYYDTENSNGTPFSRFGPVMEELKKIDADIMGFQEIVAGHPSFSAGRNVLEEICESLNAWKTDPNTTYQYHYAYSRYYTDDHATSPTAGSGIISKYPILKSEKVLFGGKGWTDDSERNLDTPSVPRAFAWYQIDVDQNGKYEQGGSDIIFYNTHLSTGYNTNGISGAQLQYMVQYMQEHHANDRVVCTGDMNLAPYHVGDVLDKVNASSGGNTSVAQKFIALNGDKNHNTYTRTNPNSGSMVDNIIVSENVEYFKFGESKFSASPALNTSVTLYGSDYSYGNMNSYREAYEKYYDLDSSKHFRPVRDPSELKYDIYGNPTNGVSNEIYADDPQWTASDHMPIWAYIKK